jgi:hypothetical protein
MAETAELVARQLLERYGIVARELLELEALPLSWGVLYDALNRLELTGEIRRGYFVEGFSGAQFGLPRACDDLKAIQERRGPALPRFVLLNACDPANLHGTALREPPPDEQLEEEDGQREYAKGGKNAKGDTDQNGLVLPEGTEPGDEVVANDTVSSPARHALPRLPTNYLVLRDGTPVLLLEAAARRLTPMVPLSGEELAAACGTLRELIDQRWPLRPFRQFRLERWGDGAQSGQRGRPDPGRPIRGSEAEAPLRALGFSISPKGLEL